MCFSFVQTNKNSCKIINLEYSNSNYYFIFIHLCKNMFNIIMYYIRVSIVIILSIISIILVKLDLYF